MEPRRCHAENNYWAALIRAQFSNPCAQISVINSCARITKPCAWISKPCAQITKPCARINNSCARITKSCAWITKSCTRITNSCARFSNPCAWISVIIFRMALPGLHRNRTAIVSLVLKLRWPIKDINFILVLIVFLSLSTTEEMFSLRNYTFHRGKKSFLWGENFILRNYTFLHGIKLFSAELNFILRNYTFHPKKKAFPRGENFIPRAPLSLRLSSLCFTPLRPKFNPRTGQRPYVWKSFISYLP